MIIKLMKRLSDAQGWHELSGYYLQTVVVNMITNKPNEKPGDSFQNTEIIVSFEYFPYKCRSVDVFFNRPDYLMIKWFALVYAMRCAIVISSSCDIDVAERRGASPMTLRE